MIATLKPNQIFVFGSNLAGAHAGGAAKQAHDEFGAEWGVGEGLTGKTYAFPTLDANLERRNFKALSESRNVFYRCAVAHPELEFLLTKVGTGIAGYSEERMKQLFRDVPENVVKPEDWK